MLRPASLGWRTAALSVFVLAFAACSHFGQGGKSPAAPRSVHELQELAADGTATRAFPQYWKRNTLVIDMRGAASSGQFTLKPRAGRKWPMRIAFRATPGTLGLLEVTAEQRALIPVTREGTEPVDIELLPGVYTAKTPQIEVRWGK